MILSVVAAVAVSVSMLMQSATQLPEIQALVRSREGLETSVRQVKAKQGGEAGELTKLEQQYAALTAAFDKWRAAAASSDANVRRGLDAMAGDLAKAMATFGRDARTFVSGHAADVRGAAVRRFEGELKDAARVLGRADAAIQQSAASGLTWRTWADIR